MNEFVRIYIVVKSQGGDYETQSFWRLEDAEAFCKDYGEWRLANEGRRDTPAFYNRGTHSIEL